MRRLCVKPPSFSSTRRASSVASGSHAFAGAPVPGSVASAWRKPLRRPRPSVMRSVPSTVRM